MIPLGAAIGRAAFVVALCTSLGTSGLGAGLACVTAAPTTDEPVLPAAKTRTTTTTTTAPDRDLSAEATRATLQAELLLQEGDVPGAVAELKAAVIHDDGSPYLRLRLGEALLLLGDADGADAAADAAVRLAGSSVRAVGPLRLKAAAREQLGDIDGSIVALRAALGHGPDRMSSAMLAERLVAKGELHAAEDVVDLWMKAEPGAVDGWVALGRVFAERGEIDRAFVHLRHALATKPDDDDALISLRDLLLALGRFDDAAVAAADFARAHGDGQEVRVMLLASLALRDHPSGVEEARALAKAWLDDDGGDDTRRLVADGFERAGLIDDAVACLAAAPAPRALVSLERARLLLHQRKPEDAAALACPVASRAGGIEERLQEFAVTLCARAEADGGDVDGAVLRLIEASSVRPRSVRLVEALRSVVPRAQASRQAAARQHVERLLADNPEADLVIAAAFVKDAAGDHAGGKALLTTALAKRPADRALVFGHARLLDQQALPGAAGNDDARGAVELVERLVERSGADVDTLNFMAFTLAEHQLRADVARSYAWRAVLLDPLNGYVQDTLGWARLVAGDVDDATATLQRAARLSPDEGEILFHLATALFRQKNKAQARETLAKSRALLETDDPLLPRVLALEQELQKP
ncbi:MAG: tetratricopeptide repeat protein [Deltaproteobacteria bacterium]|nr:tetratricopeptide repeat protein [Deltaproteobacteria bacterium]